MNLHGEHSEWVLGEWLRMWRRVSSLSDIFCQTSANVPSKNWSISGIQQWIPSDIMRPYPTIRLHCPSTPPPHKAFSSSEARHVWQPGYGRKL